MDSRQDDHERAGMGSVATLALTLSLLACGRPADDGPVVTPETSGESVVILLDGSEIARVPPSALAAEPRSIEVLAGVAGGEPATWEHIECRSQDGRTLVVRRPTEYFEGFAVGLRLRPDGRPEVGLFSVERPTTAKLLLENPIQVHLRTSAPPPKPAVPLEGAGAGFFIHAPDGQELEVTPEFLSNLEVTDPGADSTMGSNEDGEGAEDGGGGGKKRRKRRDTGRSAPLGDLVAAVTALEGVAGVYLLQAGSDEETYIDHATLTSTEDPLASLKRNNKKQWVAQVRSKDPKQALQRKGLRGMRIEPKK